MEDPNPNDPTSETPITATATDQPVATLPTEEAAPAADQPEAEASPSHPSVGDEIGLGIVFGVRIVRDEGCYVQIGSGDAEWIKV